MNPLLLGSFLIFESYLQSLESHSIILKKVRVWREVFSVGSNFQTIPKKVFARYVNRSQRLYLSEKFFTYVDSDNRYKTNNG